METENTFGKVEGISILYRLLAGMIGGAGGALFIFIGMILGGSLLESFSSDTVNLSPFAIFLILAVLFLSTLVSNSLGTLLIGLSDRAKYSMPFRGLSQVVVVNIILFILSTPIYLIAKGIDPYLMAGVAVLHFFFSSLTSALVYEVICADRSRILLNIYSVVISVFIGLLVMLFFYLVSSGTNQLLLFFSVPIIIWLSIGFVGALIEYFYYQFFRIAGVDFLSIEMIQKEAPLAAKPEAAEKEEWDATK
ncbi:MAG: hypothetical protein PHU71_00335 [Candidatus Gracilibacteria bacterium]|nr:hypothetical protein [Candidatus Gracilibacteria bacterium]